MKKRNGYTLTEIVIVIGIILLLIGLAMAAMSIITGERSIASATNELSALSGRARSLALGLEEPRGIAFFTDVANGRSTVAIVREAKFSAWTAGVSYQEGDYVTFGASRYVCVTPHASSGANQPAAAPWGAVTIANAVDVVRDVDYLVLRQGIGVQALVNYTTSPQTDKYIELGVVMFDGKGQVSPRPYGLAQFGVIGRRADLVADLDGSAVVPALVTSIGFVLYDREGLKNQGQDYDPLTWAAYRSRTGSAVAPAYLGSESIEEAWIEQNATFLMVNRYNGTLLEGS